MMMTPEEFQTLAQETASRNAMRMVTEFGPLIAHIFSARQSPDFNAKWETLHAAIAKCTASQLGSIALSIMPQYEDARKLTLVILHHCNSATLDLIKEASSGLTHTELVAEFDTDTGLPATSSPFDFRDHIGGGRL
jgi:hypothetical protein